MTALPTPPAEPVVPRPGAGARERALVALARRLPGHCVLTGAEAVEAFRRDESEAEGQPPDAVVLATEEAHVLAALAVARECGVPITPRAGGTGRTGGAVPVAGGIVLVTAGMNQLKDIDVREGVAVVGPGMVLEALQAAVEAEGWFYPPDPNSQATCCLGGNLAENAGGPRAFKYGVTRDYVLGVEVMTLGGERFFSGRRTRKGVTGYDVTGLLVGSEGTLALLGDATLRLVPRPEEVMTLLALFRSVTDAARAVAAITARGLVPRCLELLDAATLQALRDAGNPVDAAAQAMLLVEVDGPTGTTEVEASRVAEACDASAAFGVLVAQGAAQRDRLWAARRQMSGAVRRLARHKLAEDVVVPRQRMVELLEQNQRVCDAERVRTLTYGHAGDGNLHVNFLWDDPDDQPRVDRCIEALFRSTVALGGTLSGEHGIGVLKAPFLPLEQSAPLIELQRSLKRVFDPQGLLNPGKIFPALGHGPC